MQKGLIGAPNEPTLWLRGSSIAYGQGDFTHSDWGSLFRDHLFFGRNVDRLACPLKRLPWENHRPRVGLYLCCVLTFPIDKRSRCNIEKSHRPPRVGESRDKACLWTEGWFGRQRL